MLLRGDVRRSRDDLLDITLSLPFQTEVNTGFGILAKVYLDALTHINGGQRVRDPNGPGIKEAKGMALEICEDTFTGIKYPRAEVERGFRFWDVVSKTISLDDLLHLADTACWRGRDGGIIDSCAANTCVSLGASFRH